MAPSVKEILKDKVALRKIAAEAFKAVDTDGSGFLEKNELEQVLNNVSLDLGVDKPSSEEVEEVLKELDANSDGKLSLEEF